MCIQNNKIVPLQGDIIAYKLLGQKDGKFYAPFLPSYFTYKVGKTYVNNENVVNTLKESFIGQGWYHSFKNISDVKEWIKSCSNPKEAMMLFDQYVVAEITIHNETEGDVYLGTFFSYWLGAVDSYAAKKITINKIIE